MSFSVLSINARRSQWFEPLGHEETLGPGTIHQFHTRRLSRAATHNRQTATWDLKAAGSILLVFTSPDPITYPEPADLSASWAINDAWDATAPGEESDSGQPAFVRPSPDHEQAMHLPSIDYETEVDLGSRTFGSPYGNVTISYSAAIAPDAVPFMYRGWIRDGVTAADSVTHTGLYIFARGSLAIPCTITGILTGNATGLDPAEIYIHATGLQIGDDGDPWGLTAAGSYTSLYHPAVPDSADTISHEPTAAAPYTGDAKGLKSHPFTLARTGGTGFTIDTFVFKPRTYYPPHSAL